MAADENLTTSRLLNTLAHDIDTKAATISTAASDLLLVYDVSVGKFGKVALSALTTSDLGAIAVPVIVGSDGTGYDVLFYSATAGKSWLWDESADRMIVTGESTFLGTVTTGIDGTGHDVLLYSATSGKSWLWDESADTMIVTGASTLLGAVTVGVDGTGHDVTFYGDTAGKKMVWTQASDALVVTGNLSVSDTLTLGGTDITATAAEINGAAKVSTRIVNVTDATTYSVLATNSGKTHVIPNLTADCTLTLPTASAGLEFTFISKAVAADAQNWIIKAPSATNYFLGGVSFADTDAGAGADEIHAGVWSNGSSNDFLTVVTPGAGTMVYVICDGTNWIVNGQVSSATVPAFSDT